LPKRRTGRMASRRFYFAGVALAFFLSWGASPGAQEMGDNEGFLVGLLLKNWALRERAVADIQKNDRELQANDRMIKEAENRMAIAVETYNDQAIFAARDPLQKARADRKKLKQTRARLDLARTRADASYVAVRNLLVSGQGLGSNSLIRGMVCLHSGKAKIFRRDGKEVALDGSNRRFLEPGDELMTTGAGSAEVQVFGGRAVVLLGEHSRLRLEEDGPKEQVLGLVQGKVYCTVDTVDDFAEMLRESALHFEADQDLKEATARIREQIKGWTDKKFTVCTGSACCSVRGTKFTIGLLSGGGTEITILEGAVDVGDSERANQVPIEQGFKVIVTKDGISEPQKVAEIDKWWEK
jgi:hypothetical protein